ncbi:MAG: DUF1622 domain-containing protein [Bacillota bacterium]|jgi:uncharacterized membrane protein
MLSAFDTLFTTAVPFIIHLMEAMGVFVILFAALRAFLQYAFRLFDLSDDTVKIELAKALSIGLEFKLGAEILKTLTVRSLDEMLVLASVVVLRMLLTFVLHWEIDSDTKHCNSFLRLKRKNQSEMQEQSAGKSLSLNTKA